MSESPLVTVAIPTRGRPTLVKRAIDSVLAQTLEDFEVVVVVDGPDDATVALLEGLNDQRVRYHVNEEPLGGGGARNVAVQLATARWIAFLDDDDVWMPAKLERQMPRLATSAANVVGFTRLVARAPHGDYVWPRRGPRRNEPMSEYLFVRRSLFAGENGIQTSTIVAPRSLLLKHPFDEALGRLQDTDWLLRVFADGATHQFCEDALTVWHIEEQRKTITSAHTADWRPLMTWIRDRRALVTKRAYAAFLLVRGGAATSSARDLRGAMQLLREAWRFGRPGPLDLALFLSKWVAPPGLRVIVRSRLSPGKLRRRRSSI